MVRLADYNTRTIMTSTMQTILQSSVMLVHYSFRSVHKARCRKVN